MGGRVGTLAAKARNRLPAPAFLPSPPYHLPPKGTRWVSVHLWMQRPGKRKIAGKQAGFFFFLIFQCLFIFETERDRARAEEG